MKNLLNLLVLPNDEQPEMVDVDFGSGPQRYFESSVLRRFDANGLSGLAKQFDSARILDMQLTGQDLENFQKAFPEAVSVVSLG